MLHSSAPTMGSPTPSTRLLTASAARRFLYPMATAGRPGQIFTSATGLRSQPHTGWQSGNQRSPSGLQLHQPTLQTWTQLWRQLSIRWCLRPHCGGGFAKKATIKGFVKGNSEQDIMIRWGKGEILMKFFKDWQPGKRPGDVLADCAAGSQPDHGDPLQEDAGLAGCGGIA